MMSRILFVMVIISGTAWMQSTLPTTTASITETLTVTPMVLGAVNQTTPTPVPPKPQDSRPALCAAPYQATWEAHIVKAGDTLPALMRGIRDLSVTQAAALNCIDDPVALPVGSVVWLPSIPVGESVPLSCQQVVKTADCAVPSQGILGAQQLFQNGMMLWRADTREIWVITHGSSTLQVFDDTFVEGEADPTASPPNTFFIPKRGFGKIWAQLGGEKGAMGWATAPESQISLTIQPAGRVSYTTYVQMPDGTLYAATVLPRQSEGWWVKIGAD